MGLRISKLPPIDEITILKQNEKKKIKISRKNGKYEQSVISRKKLRINLLFQ